MKKNTKKGFTLVELVIVIAVIAILSAILIPTFGDIISNANETAYQKAADSGFTEALDKYATKVSFDYAVVVYFDGGVKDKDDGENGIVVDGTPTRVYKIDASKNITLIEKTADGSDFIGAGKFISSITDKKPEKGTAILSSDTTDGVISISIGEYYKVNDKCAIAFFKNA